MTLWKMIKIPVLFDPCYQKSNNLSIIIWWKQTNTSLMVMLGVGISLLGNLRTKSLPSMHQSNILNMWIKFYYYSIFAKLELQPEGSHFLIKNTCKNSMRGELLWRFNDKVICSNWNYQKIVNFCYSSILHTTTYCLMPKKLYEKMLMLTIFGSKE